MPDKPPAATNLHEQLALSQQRSSWHQTIVFGVVVLIIVLAIVVYGIPDVKNLDEILFGAFALGMIYFGIIQRRKQDVDAEALVAVFESTWKRGSLGHHTWDQLDYTLPDVLIEQLTDDFHLISCNNPNGGTKTLGIRGNDARHLRVVQIYSGDASTTRMMLEKSKVVMTALERGHEIKKIEAMMDKLGA